MPKTIKARHMMMCLRRPIRSANGEMNTAPTAIPKVLALRKYPIWTASRLKSFARDVAVKAPTRTSKPSTNARTIQMATTRIWNGRIGWVASDSRRVMPVL